MKIILFISILTILFVTGSQAESSEAESILDYLEHAGNFRFGVQKDVVLVLGTTNTGKSSLTSLLTGGDLESVPVHGVENSFRIVNKNNGFGGVIGSLDAIVPQLMIDDQNDVSYYDCFGFNGTKIVKVELAASFAIRKLLVYAEGVKFVFAVSYDSVQNGNGHEFLELVRYASSLIKDMEKYHDAIALVVTKVPIIYVEREGQQQLEDDSIKIQSTADSLRRTRTELLNQKTEASTDDERKTIKRYILFIDILLEKNRKGYSRIGILRRPNRAGLLRDMPLIQSEKATILQMINQNLQYIQTSDKDFGSIVSDKSNAYIDDIADVLRLKLAIDFIRMGVDMRTFIMQKEKVTAKNLYESIRMTSVIKANLSEIVSTELNGFKNQLTKIVDRLGITLPVRALKSFFKHMFYLEFVQSFSSNNFTIPNEIFEEIKDQIEYLDNSQIWYQFLIELHEKLSEYNIQKEVNNYNGSKVMNLAMHNEHIERNVSELDIKSTIDHVDPEMYQKIQNLNINLFKLKLLQSVWGKSVQRAMKNCSADGEQLTVLGYNVLISDVIETVCWPQAKYVEIFALNKVFIDADINRTSIYLSIIAPVWEVVLNNSMVSRQIRLNGANGINYTAPAENGFDTDRWDILGPNGELLNDHLSRGKDGLPGMSGQGGGQFLGIGKSINENLLQIFVNGGRGADGQEGGEGVNGKVGEDVPENNDENELTRLGWRCGNTTTVREGSEYTVEHKFCGLPAIQPSDGGDGGCRGSGGGSGEIKIFGLKAFSNVFAFQQNGENGKNGKGGMGGRESRNGKNYIIKIRYRAMIGIWNKELERVGWYEYAGMKPSGKTGTSGANCNQIGGENFDFQNPLKSLRNYKSFARIHLSKNVQVSNLTGFLDYMSTNMAIKSLFNTTDLIDEFQTIDNHSFKMRNRFAYIPYYESLRDRITKHIQTTVISKEEEKALNYLYTAVMSRLFAIKSRSNHIGVVNLFEYMKVVEKRMMKLQQVKRTVYINEYRDEFKKSLDTKIKSANRLVQKTVVARIHDMFAEVGRKIKKLLDETFAMESAVHDQTEKAKENKQTLKTQMIARAVLKSLNMVGSMLSGLGPVGMVAGKVINFATNTTEKVINSTLKMHTITVPTGLVKENVFRVAEEAKHEFKLLTLQLNDLRIILQNQNLSDFNEIMKTVNLSTIEMQKVTENSEVPGIDRYELLQGARKNLTNMIEDAKKKLSGTDDEKNGLVKYAKESLDFMGKIMKVGEAGFEVYQQIREDKKKIAEVDEMIREMDDQLMVIKQHERNIHNIMIPQFKMVEQSVHEAIKNSAGKSHCELVVSNWTVQSSLDKVKKLFNVMSVDFSVGKDLEQCFEKINEGINTIMDVYDRIDSYTEKAQLANLMADIAIGSNEIKDRKLRDAIFKMETIINANLAMEQYEVAMYALKQHKFPFAAQYLDLFEMPSSSNTSDIEFTNHAINRISELVLKVRESKSLIQKVDGYLYSNYSFTNQEAFFKWDHFNYKDEITRLLNGEETTFVADIKDGLGFNAVKFNEVWLKFKLKNPIAQKEFDAEIKKFSVVMQMVGNNFYRCAKRVYYISLENPFRISYSLENGRVIKPNQVYGKLATGDSFLSPYSTWLISLKSKTDDDVDYKRLKQFKRHIAEIVLEGRGQYLDNKEDIIYEKCNDNLDKYYRLDSISSLSTFQ